MTRTIAATLAIAAMHLPPTVAAAPSPVDPSLSAAAGRASAALVAKHGAAHRARIERGAAQVLAAWRPSDGDAATLAEFLEAQFVAEPAQLDALLDRFEQALEAIDGAIVEQNRALSLHAVLDLGPMLEVDRLLATFDAGAHLVRRPHRVDQLEVTVDAVRRGERRDHRRPEQGLGEAHGSFLSVNNRALKTVPGIPPV